ncbi:hypothetical protein GPY61_29995 [Massilia sp. NEAU-DD11]|uniref:Uncharacterized protein n=1 Tax=Massilia cellulosiltytica TaxID=2683234 RepID=A0A7X3G5Q3_9BURK|nr:hypothetical protein [Telluria cellulosilytica]MVW64170.1 hypothetical protein [Telluria cellulosilytica]
MARHTLFTKERTVYWPSEFATFVNFLKGQDDNGQQRMPALYGYNTGAMILAAAVGVVRKRKREVGAKTQEISTATFASQGLEAYLFLLPLLGRADASIDLLRPEHEDELLREFERYAAGGFEVLQGMFDASAGKSAEVILQQEMRKVMHKAQEQVAEALPDLFNL